MSNRMTVSAAIASVALVLSGVAAQHPTEDTSGTMAEVRVELPEARSEVAVVPLGGSVVVELPGDSRLPQDFESASGGLIRAATVERLAPDRIALHLETIVPVKILLEEGELVLRFEKRSAATDGPRDDLYRVGAQDKIHVTVHNHPELTTSLVISQAGTVTAPFLGSIPVAGLTVDEVATRLATMWATDFVVDPEVDVQVEEYNSQWVLVTGEARNPGKVALRGGTRLKEMIAEVGGLTEQAGEQITISREGAQDGTASRLVIDRTAFEQGGSNPRLRHGDVVNIGRAEYAYIQGEVRNPTRIRIERGMTLLRAVSLAGGLTDWAKRKEVRIIRSSPEAADGVYDLDDIEDARTPDPVLHGGEIIIVKRRFF